MFLMISLRMLTSEVYNMMGTLVYNLPQLKLINLSLTHRPCTWQSGKKPSQKCK